MSRGWLSLTIADLEWKYALIRETGGVVPSSATPSRFFVNVARAISYTRTDLKTHNQFIKSVHRTTFRDFTAKR